MILQLLLPGPSGPIEIPEPAGFKFAGTDKGTLANVLNEALKYIFPFAGLILFFMLIAGGFRLLTSAGNPESTAKGYKMMLMALVGFIVIFVSYWLMQILEVVLGIKVF